MRTRVDVLGVSIDRIDLAQAEARVDDFVASGQPHQVATVNLDFISRALRNPDFREVVNASSLVVPDGMPVLWAARLLGETLPRRITGMDLVHIGCRLAQKQKHGIFLLGAAPGVGVRAASVLRSRYPGLCISGVYSPPFRDLSARENERIVDLIVASGARHLFVALGSPKQEFWIRDNLHRLGACVGVGIGGVFNYLAGEVKRAPAWMQHAGFEWLARMIQQPHLTRRYLVDDLPVFFRLLEHKLTYREVGEGESREKAA